MTNIWRNWYHSRPWCTTEVMRNRQLRVLRLSGIYASETYTHRKPLGRIWRHFHRQLMWTDLTNRWPNSFSWKLRIQRPGQNAFDSFTVNRRSTRTQDRVPKSAARTKRSNPRGPLDVKRMKHQRWYGNANSADAYDHLQNKVGDPESTPC